MNTFISKNGYAIPLTPENYKTINKSLSIFPIETSKVKYTFVKPQPVMCYRKSKNFLYLPRYYGYLNYGKPKEVKNENISTKINLEFNGELRDYQQKIADISMEHFEDEYKRGGLLALSTGSGKCHGIDTPILMYDGTVKMVQNVLVGDQLMGDDSKPRNVKSLARGQEEMYEIKPIKGESYTVNKSHILSLRCTSTLTSKKYPNWKSPTYIKDKIIDISVEEYLKQSKTFKHMFKGYKVPITFREKEIPFDPYLLGLWLGDGNSASPGITNQDSSIVKYLIEKLPKDCYLSYHPSQNYCHYRIKSTQEKNYFWDEIKELGLVNNKHIPHVFLCNSRENQLSLLAGLIDSDGYYDGGCYEIIQKNKTLSDNILFLCRSLGFGAYQKECEKSCKTSKGKFTGTYYRICFSGDNIQDVPCLVPRKKAEPRKQIKNVLNYGFKVISKGEGKYYGFELDGNHRYLLGDFTVTHNTALALYLSSKLKVKTLIVVHKEILLQQWIERIEQFLPEARIGKIQGKTIDVEDKDIIIGMAQSISMKEYDPKVFGDLGLMIIDEVHFINSKVFSKVLFKIQTKFKLGLSATPKRADGLDKVVEYHIGPIIYTLNNTILDPTIHFVNSPQTIVELQTMRGGNVNLSKFITDIAKEQVRNEFIIDLLSDYIKEDRSIIVFSDRVQHCKTLQFLFSQLETEKTSGLFIGGMKQIERVESMTKDVLFATFKMTSEGFDMPKLDTAVFTTPKSNVIQCVGRILRQVNKNKPVVVDIVDNYGVVMGMKYKRRRYYAEKEYEIYNLIDGVLQKEGTKKKKTEKSVCKIRQEE
jgi:superfamily II DNA or RNA helicase